MGENENKNNGTSTESLDALLTQGFEREYANADGGKDTADNTSADTISPDAGAGNTPSPASETAETDTQTETIPEQSAPSAEQPIQQESPAEDPTMVQLRNLQAQFSQLIEQNRQLQEAIISKSQAQTEQNQIAEEAANQAAGFEIPKFDFSVFKYGDENEQQDAFNAWAKQVMESAVQRAQENVLGEIKPIRDDYETKAREAAITSAKNEIYNDPRFVDFRDRDVYIENIISQNPELGNMEPAKARLYAGLIDRGLRSDPNRKMTTEELIKAATDNPDVMKAIELRRVQNIQDKQKNLPKMGATLGIGNAAPVPENKPQTKDDVFAALDRAFR